MVSAQATGSSIIADATFGQQSLFLGLGGGGDNWRRKADVEIGKVRSTPLYDATPRRARELEHLSEVDRDATVPRSRRELELALTRQRDEIATLETNGIPGVQVALGVTYASVRKSAVRGTLNLKYAIPVEVTVSSHEASTRPPRSSSVQNSSQKNSSSLSRVVQVRARDLVR